MAKHLVLEDFVSVGRRLEAGDVVDDSLEPLATLYAAGLTTIAYVDAMEPYVIAWRLQARANINRPSLAALLLVAGFFFGAGSGDMVGPAGATPNTAVVFDGPTGKLTKASSVGIDGSGNITTPGTVDGRDVSVDGANLDALGTAVVSHVNDTANPHATTAAQVGAVPVGGHAGQSVVGKSDAGAGNASDIVAAADDRILARTGGLLGFVQLALGMIPDGLITLAKMAASAADQAAGTASLRSLGATGVQACAGNDARLSDARAPTGAAGGQLGDTYPNPSVRGLRETTGPTLLTMGAVADGQVLTRSGANIIGTSVAGGVGAAPCTFGAGSVAATTTTRYLVPGYDTGTAPLAPSQEPMTRAGTLRNLFVRHNTPAGNGLNIVYTVRKNGVATALSVTLASTATQGSDTVNTVAFVAGDRIDIEVTKAASVAASPSDVQATLEAA